jgi:hypothetical protein
MVLGIPTISLALRHWPIQGPQAFARTTPFISLRDCIWPSRSMVARTCSEPGVTRKGTAALKPCALACSATSAARLMSSYEEFVQLLLCSISSVCRFSFAFFHSLGYFS